MKQILSVILLLPFVAASFGTFYINVDEFPEVQVISQTNLDVAEIPGDFVLSTEKGICKLESRNDNKFTYKCPSANKLYYFNDFQMSAQHIFQDEEITLKKSTEKTDVLELPKKQNIVTANVVATTPKTNSWIGFLSLLIFLLGMLAFVFRKKK